MRPWKLPVSVTILYRPFGLPLSRASLIAASFASVPLLQKKHRPPKSVRSPSAWPSSACGSVYHVFGTWMSWRDLLLNRLHDPRRAVAEEAAAPAGEEVEVAVALGVPHPRVLAADEAHRVARVVRRQVLLRECQ